MSSRRGSVLIVFAFAVAFAISALLFGRSRSADFDAHGRVLEAIGRVRALDRQLSEQVLSARFGLLNQYDSVNATEEDLRNADAALATRLKRVTTIDGTLASALGDLEASIAAKCAAAERFKTDNSVLRNSTYYLPTAANDLAARLASASGTGSEDRSVERVAQTGLAYNLIGDDSARAAHAQALDGLRARTRDVPDRLQPTLNQLIAHAEVIAREVPAVDGWVQKVTAPAVAESVVAVERDDEARFGALVALSNRYRLVLYGWSLVLLCAVGAAGVQLRRAYAGLEAKVALRTAELRKALDALWGEMKLARKIQEALVPASPALGGCEIAARMRATDDVGGDYYDVIHMDGCDWILIGDVSGHGVPAGLIMMMCHTAVRTVLASNPAVTPDALLAMVNPVLTENIRQLGEDKYMTICAFRRTPDGCITFAGAHQDVQIYRSASASVEMLPSTGLWLGLQNDIASALTLQQIRLARGDQLLLHTDGITEATRDGVLLDVGGLRDLFREAGPKSADQVLERVFSALEGYTVTDDATVVVLKQL
ncbi:MAG: PP2C family protein-serine/threonine phosphatase [Polyangiaceae bacterium]